MVKAIALTCYDSNYKTLNLTMNHLKNFDWKSEKDYSQKDETPRASWDFMDNDENLVSNA